MTSTVRPQGRAQREAQARQQASEGSERLGALLVQAEVAMRAAVEAWRCGVGLGALDSHIKGALADLRRARARLVLDAAPAGATQRWGERARG